MKDSFQIIKDQAISRSTEGAGKPQFEKTLPIKKLNDPRFGEITIVQNPQTKDFFASKEITFTDRNSFETSTLEAKTRMELNHPHLLNLLDYSITQQNLLCSNFYILKLCYEYPRTDLKKEHLDRFKRTERFTGNELRNILNQQSQALEYLHLNGKFHGDVQPLMIAYDRESLQTKLIDRFDLNTPEKLRINQKNKFISGQDLYISPQSLDILDKGTLKHDFDPRKNDYYALGLTILELGNLRSIKDIYDFKYKKMNPDILQKHLDEFGQNYGDANPELVHTVAGMVNFDENQRFGAIQVQRTEEGENIINIITVKAQPVLMNGISLFESGIFKETRNNNYTIQPEINQEFIPGPQSPQIEYFFQKQSISNNYVRTSILELQNNSLFNAQENETKKSTENNIFNTTQNSTFEDLQNEEQTSYITGEVIGQQLKHIPYEQTVISTPFHRNQELSYSFANEPGQSDIVYVSPPSVVTNASGQSDLVYVLPPGLDSTSITAYDLPENSQIQSVNPNKSLASTAVTQIHDSNYVPSSHTQAYIVTTINDSLKSNSPKLITKM